MWQAGAGQSGTATGTATTWFPDRSKGCASVLWIFPSVHDEFQYDADVRLRESKTPLEVIDAEFRKVLAQIGAHDVQEIEPFD